jgi:hypothetical protein
MAVVQISKIQVRRGQKNSSSGVPQLSSAEFAWTVDSQELFIGNGSVAEGAPYVGNTKILTEHDNILELISSYQFAAADTSITLSVPRGFQSKIDEIEVSVVDFGAVGDGSTDNVVFFETAATQLFRNSNTLFRKVLVVPNGEFFFASDLALPSGVMIRGETQRGSILNIGDNNIRFITSTGLELVDFSSGDETTRPQNIKVSNLTIQRTVGQTVLSGVASSEFSEVLFKGDYDIQTDAVTSLALEPAAVFWNNNKEGVLTTDITFKSCIFEGISIGAKCTQTIAPVSGDPTGTLSVVKFIDTKFFNNNTSVYVIGEQGQLTDWKIDGCTFEEIYASIFRSTNGINTLIQNSKFKNCGNGTGLASAPETPIVYFEEKTNNRVINCSSDRQQASLKANAAVVEVYNGDIVSFNERVNLEIKVVDYASPLAAFSAFNKYMTINYFLNLGVFTRIGELTLLVGDDRSEVAITDNYQYSSSLATSPGGSIMTALEFSATLASPNGDSAVDTVVLSYQNPNPSFEGIISFDVTYGV